MPKNCNWITPDWPAPSNVKALTTVRQGGFSNGPYEGLNLADHVGDSAEIVSENRHLLKTAAKLPNDPLWLKQVHGTTLITLGDYAAPYPVLEADAACAFSEKEICSVLTADCLPLLLCDRQGTRVSAVHAGWRGLAAGVIEAAVLKLNTAPNNLMVWLGPAIGPQFFEVREDVLRAFENEQSLETFMPTETGTWLCNIYALAKIRLRRLGITAIFGGTFCTYQESQRFYSFRRSGTTGRMTSLIWLEPV
jgi:YfiH family protein